MTTADLFWLAFAIVILLGVWGVLTAPLGFDPHDHPEGDR